MQNEKKTENAILVQSIAQKGFTPPNVKDIHIKAEELIQRNVNDFETDLRLQANILAKDDEIILTNHVKSALLIIRREKEKKWISELMILLGGALLGAGIAGFINEMSVQTLRPLWITVYVILGMLGFLLIFIAYMYQYTR